MSSGAMDVACPAVDFTIAHEAIVRDLRDSQFAGYSRIYDDGAA